jgi:transcription initiation factor IIF auxiliary subunit
MAITCNISMDAGAVESERSWSMNIEIKQNSSYIDDRRWNWSVWLTGPSAELDQIDHVTYTLHPTFPNPVREIHTRRGGFRLKSSGWGEFTIYIDIARKDGEILQLNHDLKLTAEPAKRAAPAIRKATSVSAKTANSTLQKAVPVIKDLAKAFYHKAIEEVAQRLPASTVFVSGGVADTEAIHRLSSSLAKLNVNILSATDDTPSGVPFHVHIENMIEQATLAIFLISGRPSMWMNQEIETAKRDGKRIVPVLVGSESELPESLRDLHSLRIDRLDSVADIAQGILKP